MSEFDSFLRQHDKTARPATRTQRTAPSLDEQVDVLKETLHKKIDACFIRYGLTGLEKIDEAIANTLREFIEGKKKPSAISPLQSNLKSDECEEETDDDTEEMDETMLAAQIIDCLPAEENVNEEPQYVSNTNNYQNTNEKTNSGNEHDGTAKENRGAAIQQRVDENDGFLAQNVDARSTMNFDAIGAALEKC